MATPPPPPPPPKPLCPPDLTLFHHPFPPPRTTTTPTSHRKKRTKKLLLDHVGKPAPKKPDPAAPKITRPCTECGKKFWSWKALFGHMRCHPERQWRGINPPPHLRRPAPPSPPPPPPPPPKQTPLPPAPTADDHEVAESLLMLAASGGGSGDVMDPSSVTSVAKFECSSCKKTFGSHQALGGHRASHKNVKGCFAINNNSEDRLVMNMIMEAQTQNNDAVDVDLGLALGLGLGHRCGVCLRVFSSGQALGGHMRCHWDQHSQPSSSSFGRGHSPISGSGVAQCGPDLNLPAPLLEDGSSSFYSSKDVQLDLRLGL